MIPFYGNPLKNSLVGHADSIPYDYEFCRVKLATQGQSGSKIVFPRVSYMERLNLGWYFAASSKYRTKTTDDMDCLGYNNYGNRYLNGLRYRETYDDNYTSFGLMDCAPIYVRDADAYSSAGMASEYGSDSRLWCLTSWSNVYTRVYMYCAAIITGYMTGRQYSIPWLNSISLVLPYTTQSGIVSYLNIETEMQVLNYEYNTSRSLTIATLLVRSTTDVDPSTGAINDRTDTRGYLSGIKAFGLPHIKYKIVDALQAVTCQEVMTDITAYGYD